MIVDLSWAGHNVFRPGSDSNTLTPAALAANPELAPGGQAGQTSLIGQPDIVQVSLSYAALGFSVVPQLPGAKHPCVKWKPFQEQRPTEDQLRGWFERWPQAGLAVVLGPVSGLFAIDVDGPEAHEALVARLGSEPVAPKVLSGSGKPHRYHLFFRHPDLATRAKSTPWHKKLEFRGHRGIIILPPSLHKSGNRYRFAQGHSFNDMELPELPPAILEELAAQAATKKSSPRRLTAPSTPTRRIPILRPDSVFGRARAYVAKVPPAVQGDGGDRLTYTVACRLVLGFGLTPEHALPLLLEYGDRCQPPWSEPELRHKLEQADREPGERGCLLRGPGSRGGVPGPAAGPPPAGPGQGGLPPPKVPILELVRDFGMIDPERTGLFELIGGTHGLFRGAADWPDLETLKADVASGKYADLDEAVLKAVRQAGGILSKDAHGLDRAERHFPYSDNTSLDGLQGYHVIAFRRQFAAWVFDREKSPLFSNTRLSWDELKGRFPADGDRGHLARVAKQFRLFRAARRLLWYLHARALTLGSDKLLLADAELAVVLWGQDQGRWPDNWRRDLRAVLASLQALEVARGVKTGTGVFSDWEEDWGLLLWEVADLSGRGQADACAPGCSLWHSPQKHHHFRVRLNYLFLGRLDRFKAGGGKAGDDGYNFHPDPRREIAGLKQRMEASSIAPYIFDPTEKKAYLREKGKQFREEVKVLRGEHTARFEGVVSTALLPLVFGDFIRLTGGQRRALLALTREVTRADRGQQDRRPDRAHVFEGGRVPGAGGRGWFVCGLLAGLPRCVGLNGNGTKHWGRGYRPATWMRRAGHVVPDDTGAFRTGVRAFLDDVAGLAGTLGVVAVGLWREEVFGLDQLREMARSGGRHELRKLRDLCLRFYLPEDYLARWRQLIAGKVAAGDGSGPAEDAPGAAGELPSGPASEREVLDLRVALSRLGLSQAELAAHLGRKPSFVSRLLAGEKKWPAGLLEKAQELVASREPSAA
jgi:hypothetical protein